jgi:hypothetical protein
MLKIIDSQKESRNCGAVPSVLVGGIITVVVVWVWILSIPYHRTYTSRDDQSVFLEDDCTVSFVGVSSQQSVKAYIDEKTDRIIAPEMDIVTIMDGATILTRTRWDHANSRLEIFHGTTETVVPQIGVEHGDSVTWFDMPLIAEPGYYYYPVVSGDHFRIQRNAEKPDANANPTP